MLLRNACAALGALASMSISALGNQRVLADANDDSNGWTASLSSDWDVLGPFPIHAREQHFLSPGFPLDLTRPVDLSERWLSAYADNASVGWTQMSADDEGRLSVAFPEVRWADLRATEGWAALQHHAVLRSVLTINPPISPSDVAALASLRLLVNLIQGSYFCLIPQEEEGKSSEAPPVRWYSGNIYDLERSLPRAVDWPVLPALDRPTQYLMYVAGDYEIRLFGDPRAHGAEVPVQSLRVSVDLEIPAAKVVHIPSHDVIFDIVDGWPFGNAVGVGLRSVSGWWAVTAAHVRFSHLDMDQALDETRDFTLAPSQTRIFPIRIQSHLPIPRDQDKLHVRISLRGSDESSTTVEVTIPIKHHHALSASSAPILSTYFFADSMPTGFYAIPPKSLVKAQPPVLALHGAGVDIFSNSYWQDALPRQENSWIVVPSGRTSWGLDWHGPSARDAWQSVEALSNILSSQPGLRAPGYPRGTRVALVGHSNGGQGAWYLASRYPDRVLGVVPAAGYIKSQAYVPLTLSRYAHFIDPALRAVLETALTPDDNDLFLSNLHATPILAIHGGSDENVPTWHSREAFNVVKSWNRSAAISYHEEKGGGHVYDKIVDNELVRTFLESLLTHSPEASDAGAPRSFTLTVATPEDSGSLHGWQVESLSVAGRLGRLKILELEDLVEIRTTNIHRFSIPPRLTQRSSLVVDGQPIATLEASSTAGYTLAKYSGAWRKENPALVSRAQRSGRLQSVLATDAPLILIVPDDDEHMLSAALRVAHDLNVYHKLDAEILASSVARAKMDSHSLGLGSIILFGTPRDEFVRDILDLNETPIGVREGMLLVNGMSFDASELGFVGLHPRPAWGPGVILLLLATDPGMLEQVLRVCAPFRTGIAVPDWLAIGPDVKDRGAAAVLGAGVWNAGWKWNEVMSFVT